MDCDTASQGTWEQSWRALERLYAEGTALSIGVSNFGPDLMLDLLDMSTTLPAIVQNHRDVISHDDDVVDICQGHGIFYQSYSCLRAFTAEESGAQYVQAKAVVAKIAAKHSKSPAQIALRWMVQSNCGAIARSFSEQHLKENLDVFGFTLSDEEMEQIAMLGDGAGGGLTEEL